MEVDIFFLKILILNGPHYHFVSFIAVGYLVYITYNDKRKIREDTRHQRFGGWKTVFFRHRKQTRFYLNMLVGILYNQEGVNRTNGKGEFGL